MPELSELFPMEDLLAMASQGYVIKRAHPTEPLEILNYTAQAQYDRAWNDVTRQCRGLIYHRETMEVVARPFPKFHNYAEHEEGTFDLSSPVRVTDKMDGSLGIMYPTSAGPQIATRGSFDSGQAQWANAHLAELYPGFVPNPSITYLFEIVFAANRIVVDYSGRDGLYLLAGMEIATGEILPPGELDWAGPRVDTFEAVNLAQALELEPRPNAEGVVIHFLDTGSLVKVKQEDYVALHKLVTGLNERTVWEHMLEGGSLKELAASVPDEFREWVEEVGERLARESLRLYKEASATHQRLLGELPADFTRKDYALKAVQEEHASWLFMLLDERDPTKEIWKSIRPANPLALIGLSEDTA